MTSALTAGSGVNVDQQMGLMIQLQNSYQANATIIQTAETLFTSLLTAVTIRLDRPLHDEDLT